MTGSGGLVVNLERPLPSPLPVGSATAVFCIGTCFHPTEAIESLEVIVEGARHRPAAFGMPRPDLFPGFREHPADPRYRSGFWATIPVRARERPGAVEVRIAAHTARGAELVAPLGQIEVAEADSPAALQPIPARPGTGLIVVCMATFEPDPDLFRAQVDSLRAQTDERWTCVISDDCSGPAHFERIETLVRGDRRFAVSRSPERLGFYRNFERALRLAPEGAELVALCDQDDRWHPEKLRTLRGALGDAGLVYSDQRLVDAEGRVLRETLWRGRRNNHTSLASMLVANTITGAATLFRRELAELALPFPDTPGFQFHDHWLGVVALAAGDVAYVGRPLYDYVQHAGAVFGDVIQGGRRPARSWWRRLRPRPRGGLVDRWRAAYFYGYLAREAQARTLLLRCPKRLSARKRRELERFIAAARSPVALAWLAGRSLRTLVGRNETLGSELALAQGILWRWLIGLRSRPGRAPGRRLADASFPPPGAFEQTRLRRWRSHL